QQNTNLQNHINQFIQKQDNSQNDLTLITITYNNERKELLRYQKYGKEL
ncbi:12735_t:CDS:1, partial [Funneliformis mosseae]